MESRDVTTLTVYQIPTRYFKPFMSYSGFQSWKSVDFLSVGTA